MAYLLPLPTDVQRVIHRMNKVDEQKERVLDELGTVMKRFWDEKKRWADEMSCTYWMLDSDEQEDFTEEEIDAWFDFVNEKMDPDEYICRFSRYHHGLCFQSYATRHDNFSYAEHIVRLKDLP